MVTNLRAKKCCVIALKYSKNFRCQSASCIPVNIVPHIDYSLVNNVSPQGILYPLSYQWMLYPIQDSLVNIVSPIVYPHAYMFCSSAVFCLQSCVGRVSYLFPPNI